MGKTQQDTSQNLASSNHNCDFPPNQKKQGNPAGQKNSRWTKAGVSKVHLLYPIAEKNREKSEISGWTMMNLCFLDESMFFGW